MRIAIGLVVLGMTVLLWADTSCGHKSGSTKADKAEIRGAVQEVIQSALERSAKFHDDGHVLLSAEEFERVHGYGDQAVEVLGEYVTAHEARQQFVVVRLLARFQCKEAFDILVQFSRNARTGFIRGAAAYDLINYAAEEARPVLEKIAIEDSDQYVRGEAKKAIKHLDDLDHLKNKRPSRE
jgi:hypothetical protein